MLIVINEWILHYLCPDSDKQEVALQFIQECHTAGHKFVVRRPSAYMTKLGNFLRKWPLHQPLRNLGRLHYDSEIFLLMEDHEIAQATELSLATVPLDDRYLAELLMSVPEAVLVTTDATFRDAVGALGLKALLFGDDVNRFFADLDELPP
jgi:hypothetical protein